MGRVQREKSIYNKEGEIGEHWIRVLAPFLLKRKVQIR